MQIFGSFHNNKCDTTVHYKASSFLNRRDKASIKNCYLIICLFTYFSLNSDKNKKR